jgi:hypothetical protein
MLADLPGGDEKIVEDFLGTTDGHKFQEANLAPSLEPEASQVGDLTIVNTS